jgi:hypothetical protein
MRHAGDACIGTFAIGTANSVGFSIR